MRDFVRRYMYLLPPAMIIASLLSHFITLDHYTYYLLGNILGYSLFTDIIFIWVFILRGVNYCWFTKLSVIALPILNLLGIFGTFINYSTYAFYYEVTIIAIVVILSIVLTLKKI